MYEQSVNIKNPVEINLLYVQSKDGILDGSLPVNADQAAKVDIKLNNMIAQI